MPTMHRNEIVGLRTQLRDVNIEYSALVRAEDRQTIGSRLDELKRRRQTLMARIAEAGRRAASLPLYRAPDPISAVERAA